MNETADRRKITLISNPVHRHFKVFILKQSKLPQVFAKNYSNIVLFALFLGMQRKRKRNLTSNVTTNNTLKTLTHLFVV